NTGTTSAGAAIAASARVTLAAARPERAATTRRCDDGIREAARSADTKKTKNPGTRLGRCIGHPVPVQRQWMRDRTVANA
ncbi:hypothetical protein, partial [Burkholderia sp. 3C]